MIHPQRILEYDRLDEVITEVDGLLMGHVTLGTWTLGQILDHLATSFRLSLGGDPGPGIDTEPDSRTFQVRRRKFFRGTRFPQGASPPNPLQVPSVDADARLSAEALRGLIARFEDFSGSFPFHPMLGPLSREEWSIFHRLHCAHHLGFARPTEAVSPVNNLGIAIP